MLLAASLGLVMGMTAAWPYPYPLPHQHHRQLLHQHQLQRHNQPRRFVAVPIEDVQLIREVRHAPAPPPPQPPPRHNNHRQYSNHRNHQPGPMSGPAPDPPYDEPQPQAATYVGEYEQGNLAPEPEEARNRYERQSGGGGGGEDHEYVDYGAHTGHHGAFGWYADFPVITKGHR